MDQRHLDRIWLLSARFYELQGLRVALAGACMALVVGGYLVASSQPTDTGAMVALVASFIPVIPGVWWLNRYYATTFGRQVWNPPQRVQKIFLLLYFFVAAALNAWIPGIPAGAPTVATVAVLSVWVVVRDWPWRVYYLLPTVAVAIGLTVSASGAGLLAPGRTLGTIFLLLGASFVPIGVLDHLLLVKLLNQAREQQTAGLPQSGGPR
jgi:hypothetical protein